MTQTPQGLAANKIGTQTLVYTNNRNTSYTYDAAGNQTNDGLHNYTFSAENQITQMDGGAVTYAYDGEKRRVKKTVGSETTYYFYGPSGIISEFTTTNTGATAAASTDRTLYKTSDKLGTAVLILNASGTVIENNRTLPYGEAWLTDTSSMNDQKFTGYLRDPESGLDYAMARYYGNSYGRFLSVDPGQRNAKLEFPQTLNAYIYAEDDPINATDPTGEFSLRKLFKVVKIVAAVVAAVVAPPLAPLIATTAVTSTTISTVAALIAAAAAVAEAATEPPPCDPGWITESMTDPSGKEFTADDLNFAARAIYGEASGRAQAAERNAVASVIYNRVGTSGYPGGVQNTLTGVLTAGGSGASAQFRGVTVPTENGKFRGSGDPAYQSLNEAECNDLRASVNAVRGLMQNGPAYDYTSFRGGTRGPGTVIGGSRFGYGDTFQ